MLRAQVLSFVLVDALDLFRPLVDNLLTTDPFLVVADFAAYTACQAQVGRAWTDTNRWSRMSILDTARSSRFSSDRAVREYCDEIWGIRAVPIALGDD